MEELIKEAQIGDKNAFNKIFIAITMIYIKLQKVELIMKMILLMQYKKL